MNIVIDTNILISILISNQSKLRDVLYNKNYTFYSPNYVIFELFKHKEKLLKHSHLNEKELLEFLNIILSKIKFIDPESISKQNLDTAFEICQDIDKDDTPFLALCFELNAKLWTGDEKIKNAIKHYSENIIFDY